MKTRYYTTSRGSRTRLTFLAITSHTHLSCKTTKSWEWPGDEAREESIEHTYVLCSNIHDHFQTLQTWLAHIQRLLAFQARDFPPHSTQNIGTFDTLFPSLLCTLDIIRDSIGDLITKMSTLSYPIICTVPMIKTAWAFTIPYHIAGNNS